MASLRRRLPPLNALRAFEVSGRTLNFRAAADELSVTQGAVAQQVRALEEHLGVALFQRVPRGLVLTQKGAAYLSEVTRAFDVLGEATTKLYDRPEAVTISVTPTFAAKVLIPRLAELNSALPDVELRTVATEALSDFDRDQVDIAVRLGRPPFSAGLEAKLLFRQELIAVASPYLVGDSPRPLTAEELRKLPILHDSHHHWPRFLGADENLPGAVFNQTALALDAALAGQGVALACRAFVAADLKAGRLVQVMEAATILDSDYFLVRKKSSFSSKAVEAVWEWCRLTFSSPVSGQPTLR
ncbi:LysR family transcriptional regulator [Marinobacter adhaerens]|uniref:LysR family transcriptional regulator n=1 Tax=Marinobacter adhaerens TaxID=1033846 RepID=A0A851HLU1_9GAMM|nr:LysR substrate-binding domain-containing protein [Marinobacter adhaerens]NWN89953.1 LysR family transcriptional regulator [Marinobacter adhaerens]